VKIVDIFLAAPKSEARGVIATLLGAHGFKVRWVTPWKAQGDRGSSFGALFNPANPMLARFTVGAEVMGSDHECIIRLERRSIPTNQQHVITAITLVDEFENLCDEVMLAFSSDGRVLKTIAYGTPPLVVVDAHTAKPPPPILPQHRGVGAAHPPHPGPPWPSPSPSPSVAPSVAPPPPSPVPDADPPDAGPPDTGDVPGPPAPQPRRYPPPPPPRRAPSAS
jgi:hypothetical protein